MGGTKDEPQMQVDLKGAPLPLPCACFRYCLAARAARAWPPPVDASNAAVRALLQRPLRVLLPALGMHSSDRRRASRRSRPAAPRQHPTPQRVSAQSLALLDPSTRAGVLHNAAIDHLGVSCDITIAVLKSIAGVLYNATIVPCAASLAVINMGQSEAKVEAIFSEFVQLR